MKKLIVVALVLPLFSMAQERSTDSFKAASGQKTLELQFTPLGSNPININGIRARWFKSDDKAFRLNVFLGLDKDTEVTQQEDPTSNQSELKDRSSTFTINIRPGIERHMAGTDRLSPYFGAELDVAFQTSSFKEENQNPGGVNYIKTINQDGFYRLGANAIAGLDYYIAKKLYLGTELGFGFSYTKFLPIKIKSDVSGFVEPEPVKQGNSLDIGPNVVAQIRLGYAF